MGPRTERPVEESAQTSRTLPETASAAQIARFVQNRGSSGSEPTKTNGRQLSVSSAWVAPMMNRGLAERCASCFWKTLETGLASILTATNRAMSMSMRRPFGFFFHILTRAAPLRAGDVRRPRPGAARFDCRRAVRYNDRNARPHADLL